MGYLPARKLADSYGCKKVSYVEGNMFSMPFTEGNFDFVWNIGTIEHYEKELIIDLMKEMIRVTKDNGYAGIAIPNFKSLPIKKSKFLAHPKYKKILSFVPGYRLDSEISYNVDDLRNMLLIASKEAGYRLENFRTFYLGSPLLVGAPKIFIKLFSSFERFFTKRKFLLLMIVQKK